MHKKCNLIFKIIGIIFIVLGIVLTVIPLFKFDSETFKLNSALLSGIGFPFVGIILIVISTILDITQNTNLNEETPAKQSKVKTSNIEDGKEKSLYTIETERNKQEKIKENNTIEESNK